MCGIAGIVSKSKVKKESVKKMTDVIAHRGPDGEGQWINKDEVVGLGHRRLSIIDLSNNASQPMHSDDGRYTIVFNGEIYNYIELKEELVKSGHKFKTESDTEVLLKLYEIEKEKCLSKLDGMFAFAIWDENEKQLFCARDRFGEKPFYFYSNGSDFIFGSEIKVMWAYGVPKKIRQDKLKEFLNSSEVMDDNAQEETFFENIFSLKAAHYLVCNLNKQPTQINYWNLDSIKVNKEISFEQASKKLEELFNVSVQRRLRSDVSVGSSLSGGLDSSCIVYTVNKHFLKRDQAQFTFSARFKNYEKDEGEYIDALIKELEGINRKEVFLDNNEFESDIKKIISFQDEPFQSASIFAQYKVMELARKNKITVLLDGQGADELLGGYETLYNFYLKQLFYNSPSVYETEVKAYNLLHSKKYGEINLKKGDTIGLNIKRSIKRILNREQAVPEYYFFNVLKDYITGRQLQQLLRYADRNSMAHSIEVRLPFLSHELVEFVFSLPDNFKLKEGWPKYILRKTFDKKLPDKIVWRKDKVGYETPESKFLNLESTKSEIENAKKYIVENKLSDSVESINPWNLFILNNYIPN